MNHNSNSNNDAIAPGQYQCKKCQRIVEGSETVRSRHRKLYHQAKVVLGKRNIDGTFGYFFYYL